MRVVRKLGGRLTERQVRTLLEQTLFGEPLMETFIDRTSWLIDEYKEELKSPEYEESMRKWRTETGRSN